ncbi:MAG: NADH:flavin oxidoreductase [Halobacteriota archaeon]
MNSVLFETAKIKNIELRNRFVMSAAADHLSTEKGHVTNLQIARFNQLAEGGVGLIISGAILAHSSGKTYAGSPTLADDDAIAGYKKLVSEVHKRGAKIAAQLCHSGISTSRYQNTLGREGIAPSLIPENDYYFNTQNSMFLPGKYHAATDEEIRAIIRAFGDAALRAKEAGFDAVQLHGAHSSLLSQFLSPHTNRRTDSWGGSLENRIHIHREMYGDIRTKVGEDYPVMIKLGVEDGGPGGLKFNEGKIVACYLSELGFDALEISQGLMGKLWEETPMRTRINSIEKEAYFRDWCREVTGAIDTPTMLVGGLRTFELMEEIVRNHEADFISLCRPLIREPGLINDWKRGDTHRATCVSCNKCALALGEGKPLDCYLEG